MGVLELKAQLIDNGFMPYPPVRLEMDYDEMENPPPFGKFEKPLRQAVPEFDRIWERQLGVLQHFSEFKLIFSNCFTDRAFYYLMDRYAHLELEIKEFSKVLNSASNQLTKEYYRSRGFDKLNKLNMFDIMREDFERIHPEAAQRYQDYVSLRGDPVGLFKENIPDYLREYKTAVKRAKEERDKIKKNQQTK